MAKDIEKLKKAALSNPYANERKKAIEVLGLITTDEAFNALADIAKNGFYSDERELALEVMRKMIEKEKK